MDFIIETIVRLGTWLLELAHKAFEGAWDLAVDVVCYPVDKVLTWVVSLLGSIDVSAFQGLNAWGSLPSEILNILGLIGFGYCMGIIFAAIMIRLGLQLIPFVRLGS